MSCQTTYWSPIYFQVLDESEDGVCQILWQEL
uniref:Uncharacterized protein n=1 Tax=Arundo donax TaxID=35708 RepID=A0A0A9EFF6_ARUDO